MISNEEFEKMEPEEQARIFQESPVSEKADLILHSHEPERLAQSLSQEELYLVTRQMDIEERGEILRYANISQLFFVSDIDCWKKDRFSFPGFLKWLDTLRQSDERRLFVWLAEMDYETVVSGFKGLVHVSKPDWEYAMDEILKDRPYFTLDQQYYIYVKQEDYETVRRAFELMYEHHRGRYAAILEGIIGEMDDVLEEEAYRKRGMRLADRGFPDQESAQSIYRPITEEEFNEIKDLVDSGRFLVKKIDPDADLNP